MVAEARLESTEHGLVPKGDGWFVLNAREARWRHGQGRPAISSSRGSRQSMSSSGAGEAPCLVLAVGARDRSTGPDWGSYTVDEAALRHGAGVEEETTDELQTYARFAKREPTGYREGWLRE